MKASRSFLLLLSILSIGCTLGTDDNVSSIETKEIDAVFAFMNSDSVPGCACSVMKEGEIVFQKGYGIANFEYDVKIEPSSIFHIASISKQFTAMAIELLVSDGKVSWDDDIRSYVPEVPDFGKKITLRHLVHHVSGLRDQWNLLYAAGWRWEADVVTQKDVLDITSRQKALNFEPGEKYMYSNTGFTLLAVVVERVSGQNLREFTEENIFGPLGMVNTHFHDDHETIVPNRAMAYKPAKEGYMGYKISIPDFDVVGASSLFTTVSDMAKWDKNFYDGTVGGMEAIERMHDIFVLNSGDTINYMHGLAKGNYRGERTVGHGGADAGYRSSFVRFLDQKLSIAVFCNFPSSNPGRLAHKVADVFLALPNEESIEDMVEEEPGVEKEEVPLSIDELKALSGYYYNKTIDRAYTIELGENRLVVREGNGYPLKHLGEHNFEVVGAPVTVKFNPEEPGSLTFSDVDTPFMQFEIWSPTAEELQKYTGSFYSEELGTEYSFAVIDEGLEFNHRKMESKVLKAGLMDQFDLDGSKVEFDESGNSFTLSDGRVQGIKFVRKD